MSDLFNQMAESTGKGSAEHYGMAGDMKKTQYVLELIGTPYEADTLKCMLTAAEQGMEMNCYSICTNNVENMDVKLKELSPLDITPCLKEADFTVCGSDAITAFIDARGLGYALTPRNAELAALQNYWVDIAVTNVAPHVSKIVDEQITKKIGNSSYTPNQEIINENIETLNLYFDALEKQLMNNKYIVCAKYTWADLHWTAYAYLCEVAECNSLIEKRKNVKQWFERIKSKTSQCGQDIVAIDVLPNRDEILAGQLKSVEINDY